MNMELSLFSEISLIIAISTLIGLVMHFMRQPLLISHIITGIVVGPSVLGLINSPEAISALSSFGIALLLFIIGLGLNPRVIRELGKASLITGTVQVGLTVIVGYWLSRLLGFGAAASWIIALALAFSSTIIALKLLSDKKEQTRLYGKLAIGLLLVQDVIATLSLIGITAISQGGLELTALGELALKGIAIAAAMTLFATQALPRVMNYIAGSQELLFLFALGWGLGISSLFEIAGFSLEVGALFAGVSLASLPYASEMSARLRPLRDFFIVLFFIELGVQLQLNLVGSILLPAILMSLLVVILQPIFVLVTLGLLGYTKNTSFKTALTMAQISEFSLVFIFLARNQGQVDDRVVTLITLVALVTIAISTYMIIYSDKLYRLFAEKLQLFERRKTHAEKEIPLRHDVLIFGYKKGGHEFSRTFKSLGKSYVVIDYDPQVIDHLEHSRIPYIYGDATDIELLQEAGTGQAKLIISTVTDRETNTFLVKQVLKMNPRAVLICQADNTRDAAELYALGATYVMMPHFIGSEKISAFIKRNGFKKSGFEKFRKQHLASLSRAYSAT